MDKLKAANLDLIWMKTPILTPTSGRLDVYMNAELRVEWHHGNTLTININSAGNSCQNLFQNPASNPPCFEA